jgi:hypothetical protein
MALGGGTFITQNKELPGTYINFVSTAQASATLSDRGIVTMPLTLDWGVDDEIFEVTADKFQNNCIALFGYDYSDDKMKSLRDLFKNAKTLYAYRLNSNGVKATCTFATAKYSGIRGNALKIVIEKNIDNPTSYDVKTVFDTKIVDTQTVTTAKELIDNDYVTFNTSASLVITAGTAFSGGTNATVTGTSHQDYLDKIEAYSYNIMAVETTDTTIKNLYVNFVKRLREEMGCKFQLVVYNCAADYEGVINVKNKCLDDKTVGSDSVVTYPCEAALVYWVAGLEAVCAINESCLNKEYDGEYTVDVTYTQAQLKAAIKAGELVLHKVNSTVRVLEDVNSLVTETTDKTDVFKENQTIRVIDQIANDIAVIFNERYLGTVPNDSEGRISLWNDIVKYHNELQRIHAIENFEEDDITIEQGNKKKAVLVTSAITVVNTMSQLYMTVTVD